MKIAVCPGSFDPITVGHLDLVERAAALFDQVVVCVMVNAEKHPMFTLEERLELVRVSIAHLSNVRADACSGLLADFARENGASALVKGVRGCTDLDLEHQIAQINRSLCPALDTVLLPARPEHLHISSTMVREMLRHRQSLAGRMPPAAVEALQRIREGKVR